MSVVRRGSAVLVMAGAVLLGPVGAAGAQQAPPDDPSISEQQAETATATVGDEPGCAPDPTICEVTIASEGGAAPQLPRTGPSGALLATGAVGMALVLAGGGLLAAGRRRTA